eukprot:RCo026664
MTVTRSSPRGRASGGGLRAISLLAPAAVPQAGSGTFSSKHISGSPATSTAAVSVSTPARVVQISTLEVSLATEHIHAHLGRPFRVALRMGPRSSSRPIRTGCTTAVVRDGAARACWGEGWQLVLPQGATSPSEMVLRLELEAVGLMQNTALALMSIDLAKIPVNVPAQHSIVFGFGTLFVMLQISTPSNPLLSKPR